MDSPAKPAQAALTPVADLDQEDVLAFLRARPNFLIEHPLLLEALTPPDARSGEGVVDFQQFMLKRLQANYDWLKQQQRELISNSRANLHSISRVHQAVLLLLEASSFAQLAQLVLQDFTTIFDVDAVALLIESDNPIQPDLQRLGIRIVQPGMAEFWLENEAAMMDSDIVGDPIIFGPAAPLVRSQLLLRLELMPEVPLGMLALGSRDPLLFQELHGTELVMFLARAVERSLRFWLEWSA
jgi:uncharacterized protein YigA (DUF484 family)